MAKMEPTSNVCPLVKALGGSRQACPSTGARLTGQSSPLTPPVRLHDHAEGKKDDDEHKERQRHKEKKRSAKVSHHGAPPPSLVDPSH